MGVQLSSKEGRPEAAVEICHIAPFPFKLEVHFYDYIDRTVYWECAGKKNPEFSTNDSYIYIYICGVRISGYICLSWVKSQLVNIFDRNSSEREWHVYALCCLLYPRS